MLSVAAATAASSGVGSFARFTNLHWCASALAACLLLYDLPAMSACSAAKLLALL
jgi:hypothetical protein